MIKEDQKRIREEVSKPRTTESEVDLRITLGSCHQLSILSLYISLISFPSSIFCLGPHFVPLHYFQ